MNPNKAAYWIALGVLALGLNSEYQHGRFVTLHRVAERADSVLCQIATRAEQTLAVATGMTSRHHIASDDLFAAADEGEIARAQSEMLRDQAREQAELVREQVRDEIRNQADVLRAQADIRRAEIEQFRSRMSSEFRLARTGNRRVAVVCPKTGERITVSEQPGDDSDDVEVVSTFQ